MNTNNKEIIGKAQTQKVLCKSLTIILFLLTFGFVNCRQNGDKWQAVQYNNLLYVAKPQAIEGSKTKYEVIFQGTVCEIVRPQDFDPFDKKNFMTFDLPTAIHELGEPFNREKYNAKQLYGEFRVVLLNHLKPDSTVWIEELTWDISPTRDVSDEGKERLTIWYLQKDSTNWQPVDFLHWNSDMQF